MGILQPYRPQAPSPVPLPGSVPAAVYLLKEGNCLVEYTSKTGETRVLAELGPGDHFGEVCGEVCREA